MLLSIANCFCQVLFLFLKQENLQPSPSSYQFALVDAFFMRLRYTLTVSGVVLLQKAAPPNLSWSAIGLNLETAM